ncbi:MAG: hypothetical protein K0R29_194 [Pseudobdellovibrio sp.]|jgi:hypothetical protein|nr:hypothetical protein [Pseudobdellovibrio sp.]
MSEIKVVKKGQFLFKAGDKIQTVYVVQSGQVNICLQKNNKILDVMTVGNGYVFADLTVLGTNVYLYSGLAMQELKVTEIPLDVFKAQYDSLTPTYKTFIKTMADKLKWAVNEVKNSKQERSAVPCAEESIPRAFGSIFHVLNHKGIKDNGKAKVDWLTLKNYSQRIFGESPKRIEQVTQILVKLKLGEYILGRDPNNVDPEAPDTEIQGFEAYDLAGLEAFFEFYQYYYFKGGKSELLKFDEANYNTLKILLIAYAEVVPDKFGLASHSFDQVVEVFKDYGIQLGNGHFTALEAKGLFCKRKTVDGKVMLQFDKKEFEVQINMWSIIREIDKLNSIGLVDMSDVDDGPKKKTQAIENGIECTQCKSIIMLESKFCSECGAKVVKAAADKKAA